MESRIGWAFLVCACYGVGGLARSQQYRLLGANDLGMHCMDKEYSVFSILPPFNVVGVQVVKSVAGSSPVLLDSSAVDVTCEPGTNLLGTVLSRAAANRSFQIEDDQLVNITKGTQVRCNMCHSMPGSEGD